MMNIVIQESCQCEIFFMVNMILISESDKSCWQTPLPRSNHANLPILFHSTVSHCIGEAYRVIQMLVGLLNLGDAGITHVGNPPKHHLLTVSGVWMNRRIEQVRRSECKQRQRV